MNQYPTYNMTTGVSPFFTNKGYHLEFTTDLQANTLSAEAQTFMADLECIQAELKENIAQAQERYQKNADKHRAEAPKLKVSDQAYIKVKFFRTRQCRQAGLCLCVHTTIRKKGQSQMYPS